MIILHQTEDTSVSLLLILLCPTEISIKTIFTHLFIVVQFVTKQLLITTHRRYMHKILLPFPSVSTARHITIHNIWLVSSGSFLNSSNNTGITFNWLLISTYTKSYTHRMSTVTLLKKCVPYWYSLSGGEDMSVSQVMMNLKPVTNQRRLTSLKTIPLVPFCSLKMTDASRHGYQLLWYQLNVSLRSVSHPLIQSVWGLSVMEDCE